MSSHPSHAEDQARCPRCGSTLPRQAIGALCPRCVGRRLLSPAPAISSEPEAAPNATSEDLTGRKIGRYRLAEMLGEGGGGLVFAADQEEPVRRRVALKILKLGMDTRAVVSRFEAERQVLAMMNHPNIAKVLDAGATPSGRPYFVMELVPGQRITEFCDQRKLSTEARLKLFITVCQAIQHAHQKGVIHRDLKPSNVLVTLHDGAPSPKIIDFGIAKATGPGFANATLVTEAHQLLGTPAYMSPEQANAATVDLDTRTDIYSLGVLLYELLTGRTPFDARARNETGLEALRKTIRDVEPPRPTTRLGLLTPDEQRQIAEARGLLPAELRSRLRGDLEWITMKCLEKDRARRYETANAVAEDLLRHLADEPVTAGAPTATYRFRKFARRNKAALAGASVLVAVLLVATGISTWEAIRATRAEASARKNFLASEKAREESDAIARFLAEILQSPNPARAGREITVVETLGVAARKIERDLAGHPERQNTLRATLGATYSSLGKHSEAIPLEKEVLAYCQEHSGSSHPDTLAAMHRLANSYDLARRHPEALDLREKILATQLEELGPEHPLTIQAMVMCGWAQNKLVRSTEAIHTLEHAVELSIRVNGSDHTNTVAAMSFLGWAYSTAKRNDEALALQTRTWTAITNLVGPEHPDALNALTALAFTYNQMGRTEEGIPRQRQALALSRKIKGTDHADTLWAADGLASALVQVGHLKEALPLLQELLSARLREDGPSPETTAPLTRRLLEVDLALARHADAESLIEQELEAAGRLGTNGLVQRDVLLNMRGQVWFRQGKFAEAEAVFRELQASPRLVNQKVSRAGNSPVHHRAATLIEWAWHECTNNTSAALERARAGEQLAREQRAQAMRTKGKDMRESTAADSLLGHAISVLARTDPTLTPAQREQLRAEAESLLLQAEARIGQVRDGSPLLRPDTLQRLIRLYATWGKTDLAAHWQEKLDALARIREN